MNKVYRCGYLVLKLSAYGAFMRDTIKLLECNLHFIGSKLTITTKVGPKGNARTKREASCEVPTQET